MRQELTERVAAECFDLDDTGAEVGEHGHPERASDDR
jgi:hypothetical protein